MRADSAHLWGSSQTIAASDGNTAAANSGWTIGADKDWAQPTGDYANTRYSSLSQINSENVKDSPIC
jgi:glucose dehydrogenase